MQFEETGNMSGKTLMLLPGTCCDWQTNFGTVVKKLSKKYHLICVNYDGFDGSDEIFSDMITVTEKIEKYIENNYNGMIDGAIGSSLGSSFVGQLVQRENIHIDHAILGSPDLDQSCKISAKLQAMIVVPFLISYTKNNKKRKKAVDKLRNSFQMSRNSAEAFMNCLSKFNPRSIKNEYYSDLLTPLNDDICVKHTQIHFIYAKKMGKKYLARYNRHFHKPDIRSFDMQHEQWLFGDEECADPVLSVIDEFMNISVK